MAFQGGCDQDVISISSDSDETISVLHSDPEEEPGGRIEAKRRRITPTANSSKATRSPSCDIPEQSAMSTHFSVHGEYPNGYFVVTANTSPLKEQR